MSAWLAVLLALVATAATGQANVASLSMEQCTVPAVHGLLNYDALANLARISEQQLKVIDQMQTLNDKAKATPGRPLSESLTKEDASKWGQLQQQASAGLLMSLMESRRQRDLDLLLKQVKLADDEYRWGTTPQEGSPDFLAYAFLLTFRLVWAPKKIAPAEGPPCSMGAALSKLQAEPQAKMDRYLPQVEKALAWVRKTNAKYKLAKLDESKYTPAERATLQKYRVDALNPATSALAFVRDLENLRVLAKAADIIYEGDRSDAAVAVGDADFIGTTVRRRIQAGELGDKMQQAIGYWRKVNDQMPARISKEWAESLKSMPSSTTTN